MPNKEGGYAPNYTPTATTDGHRGFIVDGEVTADVFDQYRDPLYREAGYKPYVIAAMILCSRFADPAGMLRDFADRAPRRVVG